jgi:hypothetical protein
MTKTRRLVYGIAIAIFAVAGFVWWQVRELGNRIDSMPVGNVGEILVGALSSEVLSPGLPGSMSRANGTEPILDEYQKNPALTHQRYLLVITWQHASQMFKAVGDKPIVKEQMISSDLLEGIPVEDRVDGWGTPYCISIDSMAMTFLSSGGGGAVDCGNMRQIARQAAARASDARLSKEGSLLVVVYKRGGHFSRDQSRQAIRVPNGSR